MLNFIYSRNITCKAYVLQKLYSRNCERNIHNSKITNLLIRITRYYEK